MAALNAIAGALWLTSVQISGEVPSERWAPYVSEASGRFGIPEAWIRRVMMLESNGLELVGGKPVTSRAGAMGLMQLMPATWAEMRQLYGLAADPYEPRSNILAGTAYLRAMYDRFGYPGMFAAYNAGPARYAAHLVYGTRLPEETRNYLARATGAAAATSPSVPASHGLWALPRYRSAFAVGPRGNSSLIFAIRR